MSPLTLALCAYAGVGTVVGAALCVAWSDNAPWYLILPVCLLLGQCWLPIWIGNGVSLVWQGYDR